MSPFVRITLAVSLAATLFACRRAAAPVVVESPSAPAPVEDLSFLRPQSVGAALEGQPWIAHVALADLDRDGRIDILACEAKQNRVLWLRQSAAGQFSEQVIASGLPAPVHVEACDFDRDGDLDLLVACMGQVFPTDDEIGSIVLLENDGAQHFTPHVIAEHIARVTDVRAADLNGDGRLDLAVALFGYAHGRVQWFENRGEGRFEPHRLLDLPGTINVCLADMDGDRTPDIVAIVSQDSEEIHLFTNNGRGDFSDKVIFGSTNHDYGSSGISLCDLNHDGRPDILYTNGDGFDYAEPGPRPWHGVQWLENLGDRKFRFHRIGDLPGAFSPVGVDLDGDGQLDVVAVSAFNRWKEPAAASLVWFRNDGHLNFAPHVLAHAPTHLITLAAGDLDGSGRPALVTGGFHTYPPFDRMSRVTVWRRAAP